MLTFCHHRADMSYADRGTFSDDNLFTLEQALNHLNSAFITGGCSELLNQPLKNFLTDYGHPLFDYGRLAHKFFAVEFRNLNIHHTGLFHGDEDEIKLLRTWFAYRRALQVISDRSQNRFLKEAERGVTISYRALQRFETFDNQDQVALVLASGCTDYCTLLWATHAEFADVAAAAALSLEGYDFVEAIAA